MRNGQKRMRGRNHRKSQNPLARVYESNGPDVKIRGTPSHIAEKYLQLARDSQSSGDPIAAENYYQHAEHYFRLIAAAHEQLRQQNPFYGRPPEGGGEPREDNADDGEDDGEQPYLGQNEPSYPPREAQPQPYLPREAQPFPPRDQQFVPRHQQQHGGRPHEQQQHQHHNPQHQQPQQQQPQPQFSGPPGGNEGGQDVGSLPSFITGGAPAPNPQPGVGNGYDNQNRFPLHRRRRRHRGGHRGDLQNSPQQMGNEGGPRGEAPNAAPNVPREGGDEPPRQPSE